MKQIVLEGQTLSVTNRVALRIEAGEPAESVLRSRGAWPGRCAAGHLLRTVVAAGYSWGTCDTCQRSWRTWSDGKGGSIIAPAGHPLGAKMNETNKAKLLDRPEASRPHHQDRTSRDRDRGDVG
jgi:hypothetical protein